MDHIPHDVDAGEQNESRYRISEFVTLAFGRHAAVSCLQGVWISFALVFLACGLPLLFLSAGGFFRAHAFCVHSFIRVSAARRSTFMSELVDGARAAHRFSSCMGPSGLPPSLRLRMGEFSCACDSLSCASERFASCTLASGRHAAFCMCLTHAA